MCRKFAWNPGSDYNQGREDPIKPIGGPQGKPRLEAMPSSISITVNGESRSVAAGVCVSDLLRELGLESGRVAIERNRQILPRSQWLETVLAEGDQFEIVHLVGGG